MTANPIPLEILGYKCVLSSLATQSDHNFVHTIKKVLPEKNQMILNVNKILDSNSLELTVWTTKGAYRFSLKTIETFTNNTDHLVEIVNIKHINNEAYTLAEGLERVQYHDVNTTTNSTPEGTLISQKIIGYSLDFIVIKLNSLEQVNAVRNAIESQTKVTLILSESEAEFELKPNNKCEGLGVFLKVNLQLNSGEPLHKILTPLNRSNAIELINNQGVEQ